MRLVLDGISAFEYWQTSAFADTHRSIHAERPILSQFEQTASSEISQALRDRGATHETLHVLVGSAMERRNSEHVECHVWGSGANPHPLPPNSLYEAGMGLYVESPELCLVRLAATLPRMEFLRALSDMLGVYALSFTDRTNIILRKPITSKERITEFLQQIPGVHGTKQLRNALSWVVPGAASPRETSMDLALAMPTRMGGQGLPQFEANRHINLTEDARKLTTKSYLVADAIWTDANLALEYNSSKYHDTEEQKEFDFEKITALQSMGIVVTPVSTRQFNDYNAFAAVTARVRRILGKRAAASDATEERRRRVHEELLRIERRNREQPDLFRTARWKYLLAYIDFSVT